MIITRPETVTTLVVNEKKGFICPPQSVGIAEHPDYDFTISDKPVENRVPWVVEHYERLSQTIYQERVLQCHHLKNCFPA